MQEGIKNRLWLNQSRKRFSKSKLREIHNFELRDILRYTNYRKLQTVQDQSNIISILSMHYIKKRDFQRVLITSDRVFRF
ncbi:unnamed protein product [Paramecium primaurelia]|uniref:Uncharacterized protein n=1 Tax=Paramecium primaurelia TaxID=5886 RepID=A0A8S1PRR3_PARPR|nr:unnamed protein product [Paramecium primaurelia]